MAALASALVVPTLAAAGDMAQIEVLGFSADATRFGIVQSGVEDGSGFPYAQLAIAALPGTPADAQGNRRVVLEDDGRTREEARTSLLAASLDAIAALGMAATAAPEPAITAPGLENAETSATVSITGRPVIVELRPRPLDSQTCRDAGAAAVAVEIVVRREAAILAQQSWEPDADECPLSYAIASLHATTSPDGLAVLGMAVAYSRFGYEGPDLRFFPAIAELRTP